MGQLISKRRYKELTSRKKKKNRHNLKQSVYFVDDVQLAFLLKLSRAYEGYSYFVAFYRGITSLLNKYFEKGMSPKEGMFKLTKDERLRAF